MRSIVQIIEDDRKGKQLSQTERQIEAAYIQGKYDALRELKIGNNSCTDDVLDKLRAEIKDWQTDIHDNETDAESHDFVFSRIYEIIDEYRAESEEEK